MMIVHFSAIAALTTGDRAIRRYGFVDPSCRSCAKRLSRGSHSSFD